MPKPWEPIEVPENFHNHRRALLAVSTLLIGVSIGWVAPENAKIVDFVLKPQAVKPILGLAWGYTFLVFMYDYWTHGIRLQVAEAILAQTDRRAHKEADQQFRDWCKVRGLQLAAPDPHPTFRIGLWSIRAQVTGGAVPDPQGANEAMKTIEVELPWRLTRRIMRHIYLDQGIAWQFVIPPLYALVAFGWWMWKPAMKMLKALL